MNVPDQRLAEAGRYVVSMQRWTDDRLRWSPRDHGGLSSLVFSPDDVDQLWTPGVDIDTRSLI